MSRERLIGSNFGPGTGVLAVSPGYALISQIGQASTTMAPGFGFPFYFEKFGLCELWGKNVAITVDFELILSGNDGVDDWVFTRACNDIEVRRVEKTEADMRRSNLAAFAPNWRTEDTFIGTTNDRRNGVDSLGTVDFSPTLVVSSGDPPYYFRTDLAKWLPRFMAQIQVVLLPLGGSGVGTIDIGSSVQAPHFGQDVVQVAGGLFNGQPFDLQVTKPTWATVTRLRFELRYSRFLPYIGGSGPIWDTSDGRELRSHSTRQD